MSFIVAGMALIGCGGGGGGGGGGSDPSGSTYTVSYDANGAVGTVPTDGTEYKAGDTVTVSGNTGNLAKTGYSFIGWSTTADGTGTSYTQGATFAITADVTLYAKWSSHPTYTVTYNANSGTTTGSVPVDTTHYESGSSAIVCGNTGNLTLAGYIFLNWNSKPNGSGTSYLAGSSISMTNADITLYAQWFDARNVSNVKFKNIGTDSAPVYSVENNGAPAGDIVIPSNYNGYQVTAIGSNTFGGCSGLTSITIPNSVKSIGSYAFIGCNKLTSITIPDSVTSIETGAFESCSGLTSITIPDSVTSIGDNVFLGCSKLTSITVDPGNPNFKSFSDLLFSKDGKTLVTVPYGLSNITIPDGVKSIGDNALYSFGALKGITIPDSVTSIGKSAFCGCTGLTSITIPNSVTSIEYNAFRYCTGLTSITIPDSVTSIGDSAFCLCSGLTSITISNSVTSIGKEVFSGCNKLTSITIPNSVTSIGKEVFSGCNKLTSITIPNKVTSIGKEAFRGCSGLTGITISNSVISIENGAFSLCTGLTSITIPDSVKSIEGWAFCDCSRLTSVTMKSTIPPSIGESAFISIASGAIFHVPSGAVSAYTTAKYNQYGKVVTP